MRLKVLLLIVVLLCVGCNEDQAEVVLEEGQLQTPPILNLEYEGETYEALLGTSTWSLSKSDGSGVTIDSDYSIPPEMVETQGFVLTVEKDHELLLDFVQEPTHIQVIIWHENRETEIVDLEKLNTISIPDIEDVIIYEVHAFFEQGNVHYSFKVNVE